MLSNQLSDSGAQNEGCECDWETRHKASHLNRGIDAEMGNGPISFPVVLFARARENHDGKKQEAQLVRDYFLQHLFRVVGGGAPAR